MLIQPPREHDLQRVLHVTTMMEPQEANSNEPNESAHGKEYRLLLRSSDRLSAKEGHVRKGRNIDDEGDGSQHDEQGSEDSPEPHDQPEQGPEEQLDHR